MGWGVSHAIAIYFEVPINARGGNAIFVVVGLVTIGFVWRGMYAMSFLQTWGFPIFVVLLATGLWQLATSHEVVGPAGWDATGAVGWAALWGALSLANNQMIFQGLIATDYGRFAARGTRNRGTATIMVLELVPMFTFKFLGAFIGGTLLATPDIGQTRAQDPGFMFVYLMGFAGVVFAIITQIRINVMNLYSGSLALSNGFDVAAHLRPSRQWWMLLVWFFGVVLYATNVINYLGTFLAIAVVVTNTWLLIILGLFRLPAVAGTHRRYRVPRARGPCMEPLRSDFRRGGRHSSIGHHRRLPYLRRLVSGHDHRTAAPRCHHHRNIGSLLRTRPRRCQPCGRHLGSEKPC